MFRLGTFNTVALYIYVKLVSNMSYYNLAPIPYKIRKKPTPFIT